MEEEIHKILHSEKNKYLKTVAIIYLILGTIILLGSIIYAINAENLMIIVVGLVTFSIVFFFYIVNMILYELHQMNKYLIIKDANILNQKQEKEHNNYKDDEQLNELLKQLEK